ncbi:hypothetical protein D9615_009507 [Tricholomella constricta]|uniref:Kelch repeat-containing protein n=1 Tax=Tricholomella constricta TaxID=117010 RepID=A0A8H5LXQ6_9AGAR|nr:hypothetical protein D9615_009507 [Tricholomella constricta]
MVKRKRTPVELKVRDLTAKIQVDGHDVPDWGPRPTARFVDDINEEIFFYWLDEEDKYQLSILSLRTGVWSNKTEKFKMIETPGSPLSSEIGGVGLPVHNAAADVFCRLAGYRVILLFGGYSGLSEDAASAPTSRLCIINIDTFKWWEVDVPADLVPRLNARLVFVEDELYVFGDRGRARNTYSMARFDNRTHRWTWAVKDKAYPAHVPPLGFCGDAISVFGGKQILLMPGYQTARGAKKETINYTAASFVLFDRTRRSFGECNITGRFPSGVIGCDVFLASSRGFLQGLDDTHTHPPDGANRSAAAAGATSCSVLMAMWQPCLEEDRDLPELWLLDLSPNSNSPSTSRCLHYQEKFRNLGEEDQMSLITAAVLVDRRIVIFGTKEPVNEETKFGACLEIEFP